MKLLLFHKLIVDGKPSESSFLVEYALTKGNIIRL